VRTSTIPPYAHPRAESTGYTLAAQIPLYPIPAVLLHASPNTLSVSPSGPSPYIRYRHASPNCISHPPRISKTLPPRSPPPASLYVRYHHASLDGIKPTLPPPHCLIIIKLTINSTYSTTNTSSSSSGGNFKYDNPGNVSKVLHIKSRHATISL